MLKACTIIWLLLSINTAWPAELEPITLQLKWKHQFQFAGYYAAKEKGYYREAGLDVSIVEAAPGLDPTQEVLRERAQFGIGTSELILNRYRGDPVVVLGVIFQHSPLNLVTLAESGIDNVHKLVGRKLMIEPSSAELFAYLLQAAHYDNLTLLPNRALILDLLKHTLSSAERQQSKLALLFLDLNDFKPVNDKLGHESGDLLLQTIAQRLRQAIRDGDYVGRLAGDEFLIILQNISSLENAQRVAEKLHHSINQPCAIKDQMIIVSASIGISLYPDDATEINALIHQADQQIYLAKQATRLDEKS